MNDNNNNYVLFWGGIYSNWYPCKFTLDGVEYNCTEQHMMHQKALIFNDLETADQIMEAKHPSIQKKLGRQIKDYNDEVWAAQRYEIVKNGCRAKFEQNPDLKEQLISHKGKEFVEASPEDKIWGIGFGVDNALFNKPKWGLNLLGKLLTELSNEMV